MPVSARADILACLVIALALICGVLYVRRRNDLRLIDTLKGRIRDVSPVVDDLQGKMEAIQFEADLNRLLAQTADFDGILTGVMSKLVDSGQADFCFFLKLRREDTEMIVRRFVGLSSESAAATIVPVRGGLLEKAARKGTPFCVTSTDEEWGAITKRFSPADKAKVDALVCLPTMLDGIVVGVLVASVPRDVMRQRFIQLKRVGDGLADALWRSLFDERNRRQLERTNVLLSISKIIEAPLEQGEVLEAVVDETKKAVDYSYCALYLRDAETDRLEAGVLRGDKETLRSLERLSAETACQVLKEVAPVSLGERDIRSKWPDVTIRSFIGYPMICSNELVGVLTLGDEHPDVYGKDAAEMLEIICAQASQTILRVRYVKQVEDLATTDGLTGLYNHRVFQGTLSSEIQRADRYDEPLSLILLDIDRFKQFNDRYGHPLGDAVLRDVADIARDSVRTTDIPARYGGEEFAILLPNTSTYDAVSMAERLRANIEQHRVPHENLLLKVTISAGVATFPEHAATAGALISEADAALYRSKGAGRNTVTQSMGQTHVAEAVS